MLTKRQLKIFEAFAGNLFREYSYKEISHKAKEKSNNALQIALKQFLNEELIIDRKVGNSKLYAINLKNEKVYDYLSLLKFNGLPQNIEYSINILKEQIEKYTVFYSIIIFGSYASGAYTNKSDLDVCILISEKSQEKNINIALNSASLSSPLKFHAYIFTIEEFLDMLGSERENLGKQIARTHKPVHNINIFYKFVQKGIKNGFKL